MVEILLKGMGFRTTFVVDYDPLHVISTRRVIKKNKHFEHHEFEVLAEKENWLDNLEPIESVQDPQENPLVVVKAIEVITPLARSTEATTKRIFLEAMQKYVKKRQVQKQIKDKKLKLKENSWKLLILKFTKNK